MSKDLGRLRDRSLQAGQRKSAFPVTGTEPQPATSSDPYLTSDCIDVPLHKTQGTVPDIGDTC